MRINETYMKRGITMNEKLSPVERNREDLMDLKKVAEQVMASHVYPQEPNQFKEQFKGVYEKLNHMLDNPAEIDDKLFKGIVQEMRVTLEALMQDFAKRSELELEEEEDGSVLVKHKNQALSRVKDGKVEEMA